MLQINNNTITVFYYNGNYNFIFEFSGVIFVFISAIAKETINLL